LVNNCGKVQPCGGDVQGTWDITAGCVDQATSAASFAMAAMGSDCPTETLVSISEDVSGMFVLNADSTYAVSVVFDGTLNVNVPAACHTGLSCAAFAASVQAQIAAGLVPGLTAVSCSGSVDCSCRESLSVPESESGTWVSSGTTLSLRAADGTTSDLGYCVQGNTVHFMELSTGTTGQITVVSDLEGTRR